MSKSTASGLASVSPQARRLAEQAASRAGLTLQEWLDRAIAKLGEEGRAAVKEETPKVRAEGASARELQERLRASAGAVERRLKPRDVPAKTSGSIGSQIGQASSVQKDHRPSDPVASGSPATAVTKTGDTLSQPQGELDQHLGEWGHRFGQAHLAIPQARPLSAQIAEPVAFDLESAVSQIVARRRALDAQQGQDGPERPSREVVAPLANCFENLTQRVAREARDEPPLLAPLDKIAKAVREALGGYDQKAVADNLERQIEVVAARIDALADVMVRPEVIDAVRREMREVHDLLLTAARRSIPIERIEGQILRLIDRVEARPQWWPDPGAAESAGRRIDAALQQSLGTAGRIEALLDALNAKIESGAGDRLAALVGDLRARFEAAEIRDRDRTPIEPILTKIVDKLDCTPRPDAESDIVTLESIDHELRVLRAAVEASAASARDHLAEDVAQRLQASFTAQATGVAMAEQFAKLDGRLDILFDRLSDANALERTARNLIENLQDRGLKSERGEANAEVAERLSAFRHEWAEAERRTETLLQGARDLLERLVARFPGAESERPLADCPDRENEGRGAATRLENSVRVAGLGGFAPRFPEKGRRATAGGENALNSEELEDEYLLEPGAGAPEHLQATANLAQAIRSRTNPAVSEHIAAARRAAQSAVAETNEARSSAAWPRVEQNMQNAKRFYAQHKRSLLLAAALALTLIAVAQMMGAHAPLLQKSEANGPTARPATARVVPSGAVDAAPTGSIRRSAAKADSLSGSGPVTPDLTAAIPTDAPPNLREQVLGGSPLAQYDLAQRLLEGRGLPQDQAIAAFWFERAAAAGFAPAEFRLGALYQKGVGVGRDPAAAKRWYLGAARLGNARAAHNLGVMDAEAVGEKADYAEAAKWFRRAAEMGVRDSQFNLAVLYARGLGVEQDLRQSWLWFSLAAAQGDQEAALKRDEVAAKMDPDARAAAADQLAKFKTIEPDPVANDVGLTEGSGDKEVPTAPPPSREQGSGS